jgi:hypothetical protein
MRFSRMVYEGQGYSWHILGIVLTAQSAQASDSSQRQGMEPPMKKSLSLGLSCLAK